MTLGKSLRTWLHEERDWKSYPRSPKVRAFTPYEGRIRPYSRYPHLGQSPWAHLTGDSCHPKQNIRSGEMNFSLCWLQKLPRVSASAEDVWFSRDNPLPVSAAVEFGPSWEGFTHMYKGHGLRWVERAPAWPRPENWDLKQRTASVIWSGHSLQLYKWCGILNSHQKFIPQPLPYTKKTLLCLPIKFFPCKIRILLMLLVSEGFYVDLSGASHYLCTSRDEYKASLALFKSHYNPE